MSVRTRRRIPAQEDSHPDERWMASYLDMVTVLMCMFIVMFAMSTVDQQKFLALSASLATGFGQEPSEHIDVSEGVVVPEELLEEQGEGFVDTVLNAAQIEFDTLSELRDRLRDALAEEGLDDTATFTIDERGLTIGLIGAETFFDTNRTSLTPASVAVLGALGGVLVDVPNQISVEGHADQRSSAAPFATNWELSAGRSTQVLRHLVEVCGVDSTRIRAVGFGDQHPIADGTAPAALAQNRRVDIVILSDEIEGVRELLPAVQASKPRF